MRFSKEVTKVQLYDPSILRPKERYKKVGFRDEICREFLENPTPQMKKPSTRPLKELTLSEKNFPKEFRGPSVSESILGNLSGKRLIF